MPAYVPPHRRGIVAEAAEKDLLNGDGGPTKNLMDTVKNGDTKRERWANIDDEAEDVDNVKGPSAFGTKQKQAYRPPGARSRGDGDNVNFIRDIMNDFDSNAQGWGNAAPALTGKEVGGNETDLTEAQVRGDGEVPKPFTTFNSCGFPKPIMATLFSLGFAAPTPIQAYCWPVAGGGRDVVGIAKTGSGKTLAFLLPPFTTFLGSRPGHGPSMLVMAPTRELACQIQLEAERFGKRVGIYSVCVYGGAPRGPQLRELRAGAHLVVGTPGRLNDYLEGGELSLENCKNLVLDEADRMLDMGFEPQIRTLIKAIPRDRQTMMFSATWPREVRNLAQDYLHRPVYIQIGSHEATANKDITQEVMICNGQRDKSENLFEILNKIDRAERVIVFTNTKKLCESLASDLWNSRIHCVTIHGDKEQRDRDQALHSFKTGRTPVMLATDVAARGLDIKGVKLVVNYDVAPCPDDHIHRIGRTGRAGVPGRAVTFLDRRESKEAREVMRSMEKAGQPVPENLRELADAGNPGRSFSRFGKGGGGGGKGRKGSSKGRQGGFGGGRDRDPDRW